VSVILLFTHIQKEKKSWCNQGVRDRGLCGEEGRASIIDEKKRKLLKGYGLKGEHRRTKTAPTPHDLATRLVKKIGVLWNWGRRESPAPSERGGFAFQAVIKGKEKTRGNVRIFRVMT